MFIVSLTDTGRIRMITIITTKRSDFIHTCPKQRCTNVFHPALAQICSGLMQSGNARFVLMLTVRQSFDEWCKPSLIVNQIQYYRPVHSIPTIKKNIHHRQAFIICPIAIAPHGTDYKITIATVCLSIVTPTNVGRNFYSILMKFCTEVTDPKSKNAFVRGKNPCSPLFCPVFPSP